MASMSSWLIILTFRQYDEEQKKKKTKQTMCWKIEFPICHREYERGQKETGNKNIFFFRAKWIIGYFWTVFVLLIEIKMERNITFEKILSIHHLLSGHSSMALIVNHQKWYVNTTPINCSPLSNRPFVVIKVILMWISHQKLKIDFSTAQQVIKCVFI